LLPDRPKIAVYGDSREAQILRDILIVHDALARGPSSDLHVIAPHPFETNLSDLPQSPNHVVYLRRKSWQASALDNWHWVESPEEAAAWLAAHKPGPALIALGNARLAPFYQLENQTLYFRSRKPPHPPAPRLGETWSNVGPFSIDQETTTFRQFKVAAIVAHDAGGQGGWPKLQVARALGLPVVLLRRPIWPNGLTFEDIAALSAYVQTTLGLDLRINGA